MERTINHQNACPDIALPDIELVSAKVHEAWIEGKRKQRVLSRKSENGEELIVPYDQLSEPAKDLDRQTVRTVYAAIKAAAQTTRAPNRSGSQERDRFRDAVNAI
jgi:hypothetical protein